MKPLATTSVPTCTGWSTHVDALSHMFVRGEMYGGRPASQVRSDGARANTIMSMADGVVGRGVLLDIPRAVGVDFIESDDFDHRADLDAAEPPPARAGRHRRHPARRAAAATPARQRERRRSTAWRGCIPTVCRGCTNERSPCSAATASPTRCRASGIENWPFPIHQIGITAIGLHLIDNMALARLAALCAASNAWEFLFSMAPLRIPRATGCPSTRSRCCERPRRDCAALVQRYARAADERDVDALAALFHPDATIEGSRGAQSLAEWLDTMRAPRTFPT